MSYVVVEAPPWQPPKASAQYCPGVYFVKWRNFIKIGASRDVLMRLRGLETSIPEGEFEPLGWIFIHQGFACSIYEHEATIHKALEAYRARGEWFHDSQVIRNFIARYARPWLA